MRVRFPPEAHMLKDNDHSQITHSAGCDEEGCKYIAETHAHDEDSAVEALSQDLAIHNKEKHNIDTDPEAIKDAVRAKMQTTV